jgi:hypothetical protein
MKVFVSSTVYDLLDIRAEIESLLRELGICPIMSDSKLTDFKVAPDANSIETCLLNVESSDAVIVILDQRYGASLGKVGFDDISATHLEYRHARTLQKPIYFYVRDRLEADHNIHRKNSIQEIEFSWVSPKDRPLFSFLEEHRSLNRGKGENNWLTLFTDSRDLKESLRRQFEPFN